MFTECYKEKEVKHLQNILSIVYFSTNSNFQTILFSIGYVKKVGSSEDGVPKTLRIDFYPVLGFTPQITEIGVYGTWLYDDQ